MKHIIILILLLSISAMAKIKVQIIEFENTEDLAKQVEEILTSQRGCIHYIDPICDYDVAYISLTIVEPLLAVHVRDDGRIYANINIIKGKAILIYDAILTQFGDGSLRDK